MKLKRRISTQYCVETGRASWHQQRAGHISSGSTCFWTNKQAKKYMRSFKKHHPDEPAFITTTRKLRQFSGPKQEPPPVYHERKGPPPGVPIVPGMRGARRKRRR